MSAPCSSEMSWRPMDVSTAHSSWLAQVHGLVNAKSDERGSMPARKRNRVVIALAKPDTKDEGLATANRFLLPWYSETTLVHVADRPAVAKAAADSPDKKVADAKRQTPC